MPPLLHVHDFAVTRAAGVTVRLPELRLEPSAVAALYGPSGCGKTTMLHGLFGLLDPVDAAVAGAVAVCGRDRMGMAAPAHTAMLRSDVAFLLQDAHQALDPLQPIGRQIEQATAPGVDAVGALRDLGVQDAADVCRRLPHAISGGQAQRVLLAIAFLRRPALVVADEPSASLDGGNYDELLVHFRRLLAAGSAVLLATHDHRLLRDLGAAVYAARDGVFVAAEPVQADWPPRPPGALGSVPVLAAHGVRVAFAERVVLDGVDFSIARGEIVAIVGESGAGKTTLARVLAGHRAADAGRVVRPRRATAVQLCCQDAAGSLTPGRRLRALLDEAHAPFFDAERTAASLQLDPGVLDRVAVLLSGGERRRAALLRALAVQPDVLVLDEPTASLDRAAATAVLAAVLELQVSRGLAVVLITHDLDLARTVAHRVLAVQGGKLCSI